MEASSQQGSTRPADAPLSWSAVLALVLSVAISRLFALHCFPIYDDAFITYRYAENLGAGRGLVYNPGAPWEPVLGTTTPGYALVLGLFAALGLDVVVSSLALNILCDAGSAVLLCLLLSRRALASTAAVATFACLPHVARISVGGMEPPLLLLLSLGAVHAARSRRLAVSGALAALACCVRPEAVLLIAVLAVTFVRSARDALRFGAPLALIGGAAALVLWQVYGAPIPQSVRAKAASHGLGPKLGRLQEILEQALYPGLWTLPLLPVVFLGWWRAQREEPALQAFVTFGLSMVIAYLAAGVKTWGWYFYVPLAGWAIGLALGVEQLAALLLRGRMGARFAAACAAAAVAAVALYSTLYPDPVTPRVYAPLRDWARTERIAERGAAVLASDIGAIGYYSGARILDSEGLVWPEARAHGWQADMVQRFEPEYVMLVATRPWVPDFEGHPVAKDYRAVLRLNPAGDPELRPRWDDLPETWRQDYLIYERVAQ